MKTFLSLLSIIFFLTSCQQPRDFESEIETFIEEERYDEALMSINEAIQLEPDSIVYYKYRAFIYDMTGLLKEEISDLDRIIEFHNRENVKSLNHYLQRARVKVAVGLYDEALSDIDYWIENKDTAEKVTQAYIIKASILYYLEDCDGSKDFYELARGENQGSDSTIEAQALVGLANLSQSPKLALRLLDSAVAIDSKCGLAYGARMVKYMELGVIDEALDDSKMAISLLPDDPTINLNMAQLFANYLNNNDSAIMYFERAIRLSPQSANNEVAYMNLGALKSREGKLDEALADFEKAESLNAKNDVLLYSYAMLLSDLNRNTDALDKISRAIDINSNDSEYFNLKGTILMSLLRYDDAEKMLKKALEINPKYGGAYYNLGVLFGEQDEHEQSIKYYDKAVLLDFDLESTLVNRAVQKLKSDRTSSACIDLERAFKLGRTDVLSVIEQNCR